jgi:hypothetical protein
MPMPRQSCRYGTAVGALTKARAISLDNRAPGASHEPCGARGLYQ